MPRSSFRLDLHVHTRHSFDAKGTVLDLAMAAQRRGLWGFAVTDHDSTAGWAEIEAAREKTGLLIIPGIEVSTKVGHVLALGVAGPVPAKRGLVETLEAIEAVGGVGVPAHPFRFRSGVGPSRLDAAAREGRVHAVEAHNGRDRAIVRDNTLRFCQDRGLATTGGTDAHWVTDVGTAWTTFYEPFEAVEDVVEAIRQRQCFGGGGCIHRLRVYGHGATVPVRRLRK